MLAAQSELCYLFRASLRYGGGVIMRREKMRFLVQKWSLNKLCRADVAAAACILRYDATKLQLPSITLRLIQARISALKMMPTHNCCAVCCEIPDAHLFCVSTQCFVALMGYGIQLLSWLFLELRREKRRRKQEKKEPESRSENLKKPIIHKFLFFSQ